MSEICDSAPLGPTMTLASCAKINLFLEVLSRRPDGYHEIETVMHEVSLCDTIRLSEAASGRVDIQCDRPDIPCDGSNLACMAAQALRARCGVERGVRIVLEKRIPPGGGLGGGSSNAAAVLKGLNGMWSLGLGADELMEIAAGIGSDVPFFIVGGTAVCTGRGEKVRKIENAPRYDIVIALPGLNVPTADVYRSLELGLTLAGNVDKLYNGSEGYQKDENGRTVLFNRLEEAAFQLYPRLKRLKETAARLCSGGALLSGSGSSVFGLCASSSEAAEAAEKLRLAEGCEIIQVESQD